MGLKYKTVSLLCYYVVYFNCVQLQLWSSGAVPSGLNELDIVLQRSEDAQELSHLLPDLEYLVDKKLEGLSDQGKSRYWNFTCTQLFINT